MKAIMAKVSRTQEEIKKAHGEEKGEPILKKWPQLNTEATPVLTADDKEKYDEYEEVRRLAN